MCLHLYHQDLEKNNHDCACFSFSQPPQKPCMFPPSNSMKHAAAICIWHWRGSIVNQPAGKHFKSHNNSATRNKSGFLVCASTFMIILPNYSACDSTTAWYVFVSKPRNRYRHPSSGSPSVEFHSLLLWIHWQTVESNISGCLKVTDMKLYCI